MSLQLVALVAVTLRLSSPQSASGTPFAGNFIGYLDKSLHCDDSNVSNLVQLFITATKFNKQQPNVLQRISGNVTIKDSRGIDDGNWFRVRMDSWSNTEWKLNAFVFNFPSGACTAICEHMPDFRHVVFGDPPTNRPCFVPPNVYSFVDQPVNWTFPKFPVMPYGHWRFHTTLGRGSQTLLCADIECHTVPRPRGPRG